MTEEIGTINIEIDDLTCPITFELFRDPVIAQDGHVYEREAITKWILEHGTSPFTREPLQINDLQSDDYLRSLAAQRRNSTVSYNIQDGSITLPPIRKAPKNQPTSSGVFRRLAPSQYSYQILCFIICACLVSVTVTVAILLGTINRNLRFAHTTRITNEPSTTGQTDAISLTVTPSTTEVAITSNYSNVLTRNSPIFIRPNSNGLQYRYYQAIQLTVSSSGFYQFRSFSTIDMYGYLYSQFNQTNSSVNLLNSDDDSGDDQQFYFQIMLDASNYTLVATTYRQNTTGSFSISIAGPATVILQ